MVSDSELVGRLREFLSISDLNTTTTATVRRKLEEDFEIDLSDRKAFIREQIDLYLQGQLDDQKNEEEEEGEGDDEENDADDDGKVKSEEEEAEEQEGTSNGKGSSNKRSKKQNNEVKKRGGGFCKLCSLSPELQKFVGVPELARTEVVKKIWTYIREKDLQDPSNRRNIICDDTLRALFRVDSINMFQMNKALAKHIWPLDSDEAAPVKSTQTQKQRQKEEIGEAPAKSLYKEKKRKKDRDEDSDEQKRKDKRQKGGTSGFLKPIPLSDALVKFIGTGETELSRSDAVKRIWDYIKQNNLQDPSDKRRILCDEKLRELFDVDTFVGFSVSKLLTSHFIKEEQ